MVGGNPDQRTPGQARPAGQDLIAAVRGWQGTRADLFNTEERYKALLRTEEHGTGNPPYNVQFQRLG